MTIGGEASSLDVTAFDGTVDGYPCGLRFEAAEVYLIYASPATWGHWATIRQRLAPTN